MKLVISDLDVSKYLSQGGFSESSEKVYDSSHQFTTAEGTEIKRCRGMRKVYNISLDQVPLNVKNMLRSRSRFGYINCIVGNTEAVFMMESFSAQVIIQNDHLDLWSVSFTLSAKTVTGPFADEKGYYSVECEGITFSMASGDLYGDIQITNNAGGLPKSGICASQMTFSIDVNEYGIVPYLTPSAACTVSGGGFIAPTYYITGRRLDGFIYTITATDRTIFLDLPFDYTTCQSEAENSKDNTVSVGWIISQIASQSGFNGYNSGDIDKILPRIPYPDLAATCRSILTSIAEICCGMWFCESNNSLQFFAFGDIDNMYQYRLKANERTDVQKGLVTGPIDGVLMINDSTDSGDSERFEAGNTLESFNKIKIVSKYATSDACGALYSRVKGAEFTAFTIQQCYCYFFMSVGSRIVIDEDTSECFLATNVNIYLSPTGAYASISGEASSEMEWDFSGHLTQKVNQRIAENLKYHGVSISKKEGLVCEGVGSKIMMSDGKIIFKTKKDESEEES